MWRIYIPVSFFNEHNMEFIISILLYDFWDNNGRILVRMFVEKCWSESNESRVAKGGCRKDKERIIPEKSCETKSYGVASYNRERGLIT